MFSIQTTFFLAKMGCSFIALYGSFTFFTLYSLANLFKPISLIQPFYSKTMDILIHTDPCH